MEDICLTRRKPYLMQILRCWDRPGNCSLQRCENFTVSISERNVRCYESKQHRLFIGEVLVSENSRRTDFPRNIKRDDV